MLVFDLTRGRYHPGMGYKENRKANLQMLAERYGSVSKLVDAISAGMFKGPKDRNPRSLGDRAAGKIEQALGLDKNWMDQDHSAMEPRVAPGAAPTLSGSAPIIAWSDAEGPPSGMVTVPRLRMSLSKGSVLMRRIVAHELGGCT